MPTRGVIDLGRKRCQLNEQDDEHLHGQDTIRDTFLGYLLAHAGQRHSAKLSHLYSRASGFAITSLSRRRRALRVSYGS